MNNFQVFIIFFSFLIIDKKKLFTRLKIFKFKTRSHLIFFCICIKILKMHTYTYFFLFAFEVKTLKKFVKIAKTC